MDAKAKFDESSAEYKGTKPIIASLPDEMRAKLQQVALTSYRALRVKDYGRVDMRLTESGEIYVIEVNANCYLEQESEYAMSAKAAGIEYPEFDFENRRNGDGAARAEARDAEAETEEEKSNRKKISRKKEHATQSPRAVPMITA